MQQFNYSNARFILSADKPSAWVADVGAEVAFVGRSNVGKSSAINKITNRRGLARTSKTPGRTQHLVFFEIAEQVRLVDLPGYGYAKAPVAVRNQWQTFIQTYLENRKSLKGLVIPMDIRRPFTQLDQNMMAWADELQLPLHILLTKADKLSRGKAKAVLLEAQTQWLTAFDASIQLFSASNGTGVEVARVQLNKWLTTDEKDDGEGDGNGEAVPPTETTRDQ